MKKGTVVTEGQIPWTQGIEHDAEKAGLQWAAAMRQQGREVTSEQIEQRQRNAQDRDDIRRFVNGGNLSGMKNATRAEMIEEINRQLQQGLYGTGRKAGLRALKRAYGVDGASRRLEELTGRSYSLKG